MPAQSIRSRLLFPFLLIAFFALAAPSRSDAAPIEVEYLTVSPSPAVLPVTTVGEQSPNTDFKLTNTSGETVTVSGFAVVGSSAFVYAGGNCALLTAGQECSVGIAFKPEAAGTTGATLEISFSDGTVENVPLSGRGVEPEIAFSPASEDFGVVHVREQQSRTLQLRNEGEAPIHPSASAIEGPGSSRFSDEFNGCQSHELKPGETCSVTVRFEPQEPIAYEAILHASVGSATATATLKGRGGRSMVESVSPPPGFGSVTVGTGGIVRTVTLTNSGNLPTGFFIGIISGGDAGSFQLLSESCSGHELAPGGTCSAQVRFRPLEAGPKSATLAFFGSDEGGALVPLDGTAVAASASLSTADLAFSPTTVGQRSAPLRVYVRNRGGEPIETGQISIVGSDIDQFLLAGDECSGEVVPVGGECLLAVRFVPDGAGAKSAKLRIGVPGGTLTANLSGTATAVKTTKSSKKGKSKQQKHRRHRHHHGGHRNR